MSKHKNKTSFKKGRAHTGGKPKVPEEVKFARKLNREFVEVKITELLRKTMNQIEDILDDGDRESIDHFLAKIIYLGVREGDHQRLNFLFERVIGKVTNVIDVTPPKPFLIETLEGNVITCGVEDKPLYED